MSILKVRNPDTGQWQEIPAIIGPPGEQGEEGDSAYEIAVSKGYVGTEQQWLESLKSEVDSISNLELENMLK